MVQGEQGTFRSNSFGTAADQAGILFSGNNGPTVPNYIQITESSDDPDSLLVSLLFGCLSMVFNQLGMMPTYVSATPDSWLMGPCWPVKNSKNKRQINQITTLDGETLSPFES